MTWERLFARAEEYDVPPESIRTALRERRNRDQGQDRDRDPTHE